MSKIEDYLDELKYMKDLFDWMNENIAYNFETADIRKELIEAIMRRLREISYVLGKERQKNQK